MAGKRNNTASLVEYQVLADLEGLRHAVVAREWEGADVAMARLSASVRSLVDGVRGTRSLPPADPPADVTPTRVPGGPPDPPGQPPTPAGGEPPPAGTTASPSGGGHPPSGPAPLLGPSPGSDPVPGTAGVSQGEVPPGIEAGTRLHWLTQQREPTRYGYGDEGWRKQRVPGHNSYCDQCKRRLVQGAGEFFKRATGQLVCSLTCLLLLDPAVRTDPAPEVPRAHSS